MTGPPPLRELAPELWCAERHQLLFGVEIGARMTVVRLSSGNLFIHSPVKLDGGLREALAGLGEVRFVVAPNRMHHLHVGDYFAAYPTALIYASPALVKKRADLPFHGVLDGKAPPGWAGLIDQYLFAPVLAEAAFFHRASATLILTDLIANLQHCPTVTGRALLRADGIYRRVALPRAIKLPIRLFYRHAARAAIEALLRWDFDRLVMAHGDVVERGGRSALRQAYAFL